VKLSIAALDKAFLNGDHRTWEACRALLLHLRVVVGYTAAEEDVLGQAHCSVKARWYLLLRGEYVAAEQLFRASLAGREKILRREHPNTLTSVSNLGSVLESQGKYKEAEAMH
jgi:hypothetical protein